MKFDRTNVPYRLLNLQHNLWGDFHVGQNGLRTNTLGLRLVRNSVDGLTELDPRAAPEVIMADYAFGLVFMEAGVTR